MKKTIITGIIAAIILLSTGCDDKLEVQQVYGFSVITLPLPEKVKMLETVEIRFQLVRTNKYVGTEYYYNFSQIVGTGFIQNEKLDILVPKTTYKLASDTLSLFYTPFSLYKQTINITIWDNFNQEHKLTLSFNNDKLNTVSHLIKDVDIICLE